MTPAFLIRVDNNDITPLISDRLLSLRIVDEAGIRSDSVEITLDDRDAALIWPRHGVNLEVLLGYRQQGLVFVGLYVVDEITHHGPPGTLTICARAADMRGSLKAPKTRVWDNTTIGDIVRIIAADHHLEPEISQTLSSIAVDHIDQTEESDLHFLTRMARQLNAVGKPANNRLLFVERGAGMSSSGKPLPVFNVDPSLIVRHRMSQADRGKYNSVVAHWYDYDAARKVSVSVGSGDPSYVLRYNSPDASQAVRVARSRLIELQRGQATLSLTVLGNAELIAEGRMILQGVRSGIDGDWLIHRVEHRLDSGGFVTQIEAETPPVD